LALPLSTVRHAPETPASLTSIGYWVRVLAAAAERPRMAAVANANNCMHVRAMAAAWFGLRWWAVSAAY